MPRDTARISHHGIEEHGIVRAIGIVQPAGRAAPRVALAHVDKSPVIPSLRGILVRHEDFRKRTFVKNGAQFAAIFVRDVGHHYAYSGIDAEVKMPVLPTYLVAFEPKSRDRLLNGDRPGDLARRNGIAHVVGIPGRHRHHAGVDHSHDFLFLGIENYDESFNGMRAGIGMAPPIGADHTLQSTPLLFRCSEVARRAAVATNRLEIRNAALAQSGLHVGIRLHQFSDSIGFVGGKHGFDTVDLPPRDELAIRLRPPAPQTSVCPV